MRVTSWSHCRPKVLVVAAACMGFSGLSNGPGTARRRSPPADQSEQRSAVAGFRVPLHRTRRNDGPGGRYRGFGTGSHDHVHRFRHRRPVENHRWRHPLEIDVRRYGQRVDRVGGHRALRQGRGLRRHGRGQQPAEFVDRRRRLGHHRRRRTLELSGPEGDAIDSARGGGSENPKIAFVAAVGHLFGPNPERGLYRTKDGGKTWKNVKYIDPDTGFTDVAIDPSTTARSSTRRRTSAGARGGDSTAADRAARCGSRPTAATPGPSWMGPAGPSRRMASTAASRFPSSGPSPRRSMYRSSAPSASDRPLAPNCGRRSTTSCTK